MARRDADGYIHLVDRKSNMIISGGENIYPSEVEAVLGAHPGVKDVAVIGLPDEKWGERVVAVVQPRPGHSVTEESIRAFVKGSIGSVKAPKQVESWADLPRSKVGKVLKKDIRAELLRRLEQRSG